MQSGAEGDGGSGSQAAESAGGNGAPDNQGGTNEGGSNGNSNEATLPLDIVPGPLVRRYVPGAYDKRNAGPKSA